MRSVGTQAPEDLTAKARIRDTAIGCFARHGFGVSVRAIAALADVSPALVIHHFGSKDGLRQACDQHILETVMASKTRILVGGGQAQAQASALGAIMADLHQFDDVPGYMLRSIQAGGQLAKALIETYITAAQEILDQGVKAGTMKPSRDPQARARYVVLQSMGALVTYAALTGNQLDTPEGLACYVADFALPQVELFTQGLLADNTLLDTYLHTQEEEL
jgi:AcrR family transcriptional regulator